MFFRGILFKILGLLLLFNLALWTFTFFTENGPVVDLQYKKNQLSERATLYVKLIEPVFVDESLSRFQRKLKIKKIFEDTRIFGTRRLKLTQPSYGLKGLPQFEYFNGNSPRFGDQIKVSELPDNLGPQFEPQERAFDPFEYLFVLYKSLFDLRVVTEPFVATRARFSRQFQLLNPTTDLYELTYLVPVKQDRATVAVLEISDRYFLRESYLGDNRSRLRVLAGLSIITILFGALLAFSIAFPIRRLSKRLNKRLNANTVVDQLNEFEVSGFEDRKDEIGLLYRNLTAMHKQLISLFNDKERFAADVSHELKNPIAAIIANTENANLHQQDTKAQTEAFSAIQNQAVRMNKLVTEISEAAIVDHELVATQREKFNLSETITNLITFFEETLAEKDVTITANIQSNIKFVGLPDRLARVVINLVENAVSFAGSEGKVHVELQKSWRNGITITVEDSGAGVAEDHVEHIFNRFYTSRDGHAARENSSGLGLYICKQVVEAHGGEIAVSSSDELGGALFAIYL